METLLSQTINMMQIFKDKKILIIGAHPDDLEFGCGAILNQLKKNTNVIMIFSDTVETNGYGIIKELKESMKVYGLHGNLRNFNNMNFIAEQKKIKQELWDLKKDFKFDIIFSPSPRSFNPDHRVLGESCLSVFQEQTILFYEILRGDYDFRPKLYIKVSRDDMDRKQQALLCYKTITNKHYSNPESIVGLAIFRGCQVNSDYAEAFEIGRMIL